MRYISHELRNPLNSVKLGLDHLAEIVKDYANISHCAETVKDLKSGCHIVVKALDNMLICCNICRKSIILQKREMQLQPWLSHIMANFQSQVSIGIN